MTSPINGIMERLGQKEGGTSMTLDHITRVLEELNCSPSSEDPDSFILGKRLLNVMLFFVTMV